MISLSKKLCLGFVLSLLCLTGYSQVGYYGKIETGFSAFFMRTSIVDPGPNWLGYYLNDNQNGAEINLINGIEFNKKKGVGIGIGYLNYEGIDGVSLFVNFERLPKETKLSSIANLKIGYNHIWNQYENGSGGLQFELCAGGNYWLSENIGIYLQAGIAGMLEALFIPVKIGVRF